MIESYDKGFVVFSVSPPDNEAIILAKNWVSENGLNTDQVKIVKRDYAVCVEVK